MCVLVWFTNRKWHMCFRLLPKSLILNDLERRNGRYLTLFTNWVALGVIMSQWLKFDPYCQTYTPETLFLNNTCFMALFSETVDTSIFSVWARHTDAARPSLAAVSGTHRFQVGCAHLPMPAWYGATVLRVHPTRRRFQPPPSPVVVILTASDPTYTAVHCWWWYVSGGWKPSLKQSAARRHLSSDAEFFPEPPQNLYIFPTISSLTVFGF